MLQVNNPSTGEKIQDLNEDNVDSVRLKFERAKAAQKDWFHVPYLQRAEIIKNFSQKLRENLENLALTLTQEMGKPITQSRHEIQGTLHRIDFFLENTLEMIKDRTVFKTAMVEEKISQEPLGTLANISAWNYPYFVGSNVFVPALLTGNAVLYKPSEFASLSGLRIEKLLISAGVPSDIFTTLIGSASVGKALLNTPIDGVFFTGSFATGSQIKKQLADRMIKTQFELGGKDPIYICEDVDINLTAPEIADGVFYNTGQSCCSVERIYVHESSYNSFIENFMQAVNSFVMGDPMKEDTYLGPITRKAHLDYLENQVKDAQSKGARLLCGGQRVDRPGYFFQPTVFVNVNHSMQLMKEETFGPIIGIQKVKNDEEALHWMNDTHYGLTASIYTNNKKRAISILSEMNTGTVYWNCCDRVSPRLPWSGRNHSGMGTTLSTAGIETFLQPKAWHLKTLKGH